MVKGYFHVVIKDFKQNPYTGEGDHNVLNGLFVWWRNETCVLSIRFMQLEFKNFYTFIVGKFIETT